MVNSRLTEREVTFMLILVQTVSPTRGESSTWQGQSARLPLFGQLSGCISRCPNTSLKRKQLVQ